MKLVVKLLAGATLFLSLQALSQDLEPRRWTPIPLDLDIIGLGYVHGNGDIIFDPVLKAEDVELDLNVAGASYVTSLKLFNKLTRFDITVPWASAEWEGLLDSAPTKVKRVGLLDPVFRVSVNLLGSPAMKSDKLQKYLATRKSNTIVGAAFSVIPPLGEYDSGKLINLGTNRYTFRPQVGLVHTREQWSYELTGSVFFYTDNTDFYGGVTREQDPLFTVQGHVVYSFGAGKWTSFSAGYGVGGESTVDGISKDDKRYTVLSALSYGMPISRTQSIKVAYIYQATNSSTGTDSNSFALAWSKRF